MPTPRKPTQQKINEGDAHRSGRHALQRKLAAEPRAQHGLPDAPAHLSTRARQAWQFWREQLQAMHIDHAPDAIALEGACVNYARAVEADLIITREGIVIDEPTFYRGEGRGVTHKKKHPAVTVANAASGLMKAFVGEFGLTPLARTRFTVGRRQDADDDLNKILTGPRLSAEGRGRLK
jgi:P27 family predicted phage terminase small subunit